MSLTLRTKRDDLDPLAARRATRRPSVARPRRKGARGLRLRAATLAGALGLAAALGSAAPTEAPRLAPRPAPTEAPGPRLDLPLVDLPANVPDGFAAPSTRQSLEVTRSVDELSRRYLYDRFGREHRAWGWVAATGLEVALTRLPFGSAWLHEEWHRAALSHRGISSHNGIYDFDLGSSAISVSDVTDEELESFKADHPAELVRAAEAGYESSLELTLALEKDAFIGAPQPYEHASLWFTTGQAIGYLMMTAGHRADDMTDDLNEEDGADVARRDWVGLDFTAWAYDLSRPTEPYAARGMHPSTVGIDRYRSFLQLSVDEQDYLRKQAWLSLLNVVDPNLLGITRFGGDSPDAVRWNAALRHHLTPFGFAVDANVFVGRRDRNLLLTAHNYVNHERYFPGIEAALLRRPVRLAGRAAEVTAAAALWLQPKDLAFRTSDARIGGSVSVDVGLAGQGVRPYVALTAKTAGWQAGSIFLDRNVSAAAGLRLTRR